MTACMTLVHELHTCIITIEVLDQFGETPNERITSAHFSVVLLQSTVLREMLNITTDVVVGCASRWCCGHMQKHATKGRHWKPAPLQHLQ